MKNTKEIIPILTAIYCINQTNGNTDTEISNLLKYLFINCTNANVNMLTLACIGKSKESIMPELDEILKDTNFKKYMERKNK
ncbi:MAG: hypothetical protein K2J83_02410 [Clostridia bacterium]|nr:hypothetical protein [Clostridia bacterium]